jgi:putative phosphoribosyl transferase
LDHFVVAIGLEMIFMQHQATGNPDKDDRRFQLLHDRREAGYRLATKLEAYANQPDGIVLGLPRGGVPVAAEIAQRLNLPLDICLVRKLGVPHHPEFAMGAIAANGVRVLNYETIAWEGISAQAIETIATKEWRELQRRDHVYRGTRELPNLAGKTVILVDDGLATGASMQAAIQIVQQQQPAKVVVAVPVAPRSSCEAIAATVDELVCLMQPEPFYAIGQWYDNFAQVSDEEVCNFFAEPPMVADRSRRVSAGEPEVSADSTDQGLAHSPMAILV